MFLAEGIACEKILGKNAQSRIAKGSGVQVTVKKEEDGQG